MIKSSFNDVANNNRGLYKSVKKLLETCSSVTFLKEGVVFNNENIHQLHHLACFEAEAMLDAQKKGRAKALARGVKMGAPELCGSVILEIKKRFSESESRKNISESMGISVSSVYKYTR